MLKIQIESLIGDKYDLEINDGSTVGSALIELNKKHHVDTTKCYLCHEMKELENSSKITNDLISKDPKFVLYNFAQFPEKSFPRVDDAFGFTSSRYHDYYVREKPSGQNGSQMIYLSEDGNNIPEFISDGNDGSVHEIYIPAQELNDPQIIHQLEALIQTNRLSPNGLIQLLSSYGHASMLGNSGNDNNYSDSEEEDNGNTVNLPINVGENFDPEINNYNDNNYEEDHEDEIYDNDNYNENGIPYEFNVDPNINGENNIDFDDVEMVFDMMRNQQGNQNFDDGENHNAFFMDNDVIGDIPNNEEENENDPENGDENGDENNNNPDDPNNEPADDHFNADNNEDNNGNIDNNDNGEHQNILLNQMAMAGMAVQNVDLNEHDNEVIARITNYGYDPMMVVQVYLACDKDEEATTACLMSM